MDSMIRWAEMHATPYLGVLDTSFLRTAFQYQIKQESAPASLKAVKSGSLRVFVAQQTLDETYRKLPKFAHDLKVTPADLVDILENEWLPHVAVVDVSQLPSADTRVDAVSVRDSDDVAAAALASVLAPVLLLTHDLDFKALGILDRNQALVGVQAVVSIATAQGKYQAAILIPAAPVIGVVEGIPWAAKRLGISPWVLGGVLAAIAYGVYRKTSPERRRKIVEGPLLVGKALLEMTSEATRQGNLGRDVLSEQMVGAAPSTSIESTMLRELARSDESLSAQQLWERLDSEQRPQVPVIRSFLRSNPACVEVRRGGFTFGSYRSPRA
jgi:hypothetical protein